MVILMPKFLIKGSNSAEIILYNKPGTRLHEAIAHIRPKDSFWRLLKGTHTLLASVSIIEEYLKR